MYTQIFIKNRVNNWWQKLFGRHALKNANFYAALFQTLGNTAAVLNLVEDFLKRLHTIVVLRSASGLQSEREKSPLLPISALSNMYSWINPPVDLHKKINLSTNWKGYDKSETKYGKLSRRRIQICLIQLCSSNPRVPRSQVFLRCVCVCNWPPAVWDAKIPPHLKLCLLGC